MPLDLWLCDIKFHNNITCFVGMIILTELLEDGAV